MADKKISALPAASTPLVGTEVLPIVQGGTTDQVSVANLTAGRAVSASSLTASTGNFIVGATSRGVTTGSAIPLGLGVNGSVGAITISTSSNVGINSTDTPLKLNILSGVDTANTTTPLVLVGSDRTDFYASINSVRGAFSTVLGMSFSTTSGGAVTERMLIAPAGDVTVSTGNLVIGTAGKGIDFSANTHAAGMTSELLNDYEEGTWTPNQGGGLTVVGTFSSTGRYTRVGNQVTITGSLSGSGSIALVGPGIIFTNIPYAVAGPASGCMNSSSLTSSGTLTIVSGTTVFGNTSPAVSTIYFAMTYLV
jgi:hypothetical protein